MSAQKMIRIGEKEKELIKLLYEEGITTTEGEVVWKLIDMQKATNYYQSVLFKRFMRLAEKGILIIKNDGPRGGKKVYFTAMGYELAQKLNNN